MRKSFGLLCASALYVIGIFSAFAAVITVAMAFWYLLFCGDKAAYYTGCGAAANVVFFAFLLMYIAGRLDSEFAFNSKPKDPFPDNLKYKGYWNGLPCRYEFVVVKVSPTDFDPLVFPWWCPYVGDERQAVKVNIRGGKTIYIDNEDGSGFLKIQEGMGLPFFGHRGFTKVEAVRPVTDEAEQIRVFKKDVYQLIEFQVDRYWAERDRKRWDEIQKVRRAIRHMDFAAHMRGEDSPE